MRGIRDKTVGRFSGHVGKGTALKALPAIDVTSGSGGPDSQGIQRGTFRRRQEAVERSGDGARGDASQRVERAFLYAVLQGDVVQGVGTTTH